MTLDLISFDTRMGGYMVPTLDRGLERRWRHRQARSLLRVVHVRRPRHAPATPTT